jgi:two-component system, NtrC family, sensor kinase
VIPGVLVVDDVEANLVAISALLDGMECEIVCARSGNEALCQLLQREFAVLVLDAQMPEMEGYEVAHHARHNPTTRDVPIIFLTAAHDDDDTVLRAYGSGAVDVLFKPINPTILRSKVGVFLELYGVRRQVTETYAELNATQARLVQSAKMASLGELVAGVAHEINNPLAFAISHLETACRSLVYALAPNPAALTVQGKEHWDRAESRLQEMAGGLERIRELVVRLRTFSRRDEGERKVVSVRESVESILVILQHRLKDRIQIETHFGDPDMIDCFPSLLNQSIMNLVSNSIDAIDGIGKVTISTGAVDDAYLIKVADTGKGIPAHLCERVLEPFFTTKSVGQGTGLGLSIAYSIVKKHGGTLDLSSAEGRGTTATVRIPLGGGQDATGSTG